MAIVITIATIISIMLLVAGLSLPFVNNVSAIHHHHSSSDSRYNVIIAGCSTGSIVATDGTHMPDLMFGCDLGDVMYGKAASDVLQSRLGDFRL
jgi:hypothetical protein